MRYLLYLLTLSFVSFQSIASTDFPDAWDDSTVTRIALSLRDDQEALKLFLNKVAEERGTEVSHRSITLTERTESDLLKYAQNPLYPHDQVELTASDILSETIMHNPRNVYEIDLSGIDISEIDPSRSGLMSNIIINYFRSQPLCNLRKLTLPTCGASGFIANIFSNEVSQQKYYSLLRIDANSSDIKEPDLETIFAHFSAYTHLVRDMSQTSGRYEVTAAFLTVEYITSATEDWMTAWFTGKLSGQKPILYRCSESAQTGPLIMSLRTIG